MRICILSSFEDSLARDTGYSVRIYSLARNLAELGNKVHVVIPQYARAFQQIDGIEVHSLNGFLPEKIMKKLGKLFGVRKAASLYFYDLLFALRASKIIREADVVQLEQQPSGGLIIPLVSKIWKKPVVIDCHDVFQALRIEQTSKPRKVLETFFEIITYRYADVLLTVSQKEKEILLSYGVKGKRIEVIPNGVDTKAFNRDASMTDTRRQYNLENFRSVIFVGNMEYLPNKKAVQLIASEIAPRVLKEIYNVKFLIVGRNPEKISLPPLVFVGTVPQVAEILAVSDVALAPLLDGSGTRLKILEYFASCLPVVSTTIGIEGLEVDNGIHLLVEDNIDDFAAKVLHLLQDSTFAAELGIAARDLVIQKYDWQGISVRLNGVYEGLF